MPRYLVGLRRDGSIETGAWENEGAISHFRFYIESIAHFLSNKDKMQSSLAQLDISDSQQAEILSSGLVRYFLTINEPAVVLANAYLIGNFPPYKRLQLLTALKVLARLREAHNIAIAVLRNVFQNQRLQLGIGHNWQFFEGFGGKLLHILQEYCTEFFEKEESNSDFIGMHYYFRRTIPTSPKDRWKRQYSDQPIFGDIFPAGIQIVMERMHSKHPTKALSFRKLASPIEMICALLAVGDYGCRRSLGSLTNQCV